MKIVLACEGQCEVNLINSLIYKKQLSFTNDLLLDEPVNVRQLNEIASVINMLPISDDIIVFRIGDTLNEELSLKEFELRENHITVFKICTKTEIEILPIINEGLYPQYLKQKSRIRPKEFAKQYIKDFDFNKYVIEHNMLDSIKKYQSLKCKKHKKDEYCILDLINTFSKMY